MSKLFKEYEILYLKENYPIERKEKIINKLNRSWGVIQKKAFQLGIKRKIHESKNNGKFSILLNDTPITYYWLGFLIADGHFNKNGYITLNISKYDLKHTNKFRHYLGLEKRNDTLVSLSDKITFNKLSEMFKITSNKTSEPCDLSYLFDKPDLFFSFIVGFIDGDGTINKEGYIRIKCHHNWLDNIDKMLYFISNGIYNKPKLNKENFCVGHLSSIQVTKNIFKKIKKLNLPILERKWNRIPMCKLSKKELSIKIKKVCFDFFDLGLNIKEIIEKTKYSQSQVYKQKKEYNIKRNEYLNHPNEQKVYDNQETIKNRDIEREISRTSGYLKI